MKYLSCRVAFEVPEWFPPDRLDYSNVHRYDRHHAWAGSFSHTSYGNSAEDAIFKLKGVKELVRHSYVEIEFFCSPNMLPNNIEEFEHKLKRFFNRYKENKQ